MYSSVTRGHVFTRWAARSNSYLFVGQPFIWLFWFSGAQKGAIIFRMTKKRNMCDQCFWNLNTPSQSLHIYCSFVANMVFSDSHVFGRMHIVLDGRDPSVCGVTNEDCYFVMTEKRQKETLNVWLTGDSDASDEEIIRRSGIVVQICQVTSSLQNWSACQLSTLIKEKYVGYESYD